MFKHINKAGKAFKEAMFEYVTDIIYHVPEYDKVHTHERVGCKTFRSNNIQKINPI